jgi:hypothetical protein
MSAIVWLFVLYYPLLFLVLWLGDRLRPSKRNNLVLGCAALAMPFTLFLIGIGQIIYAALH